MDTLKGLGFTPFVPHLSPSLSITENGVTFNKGTMEVLDNPDYLAFYYNKKDKQLLVTEGSKNDLGAKKAKKHSCNRINEKSFVSLVSSLAGNPKEIVRVKGERMAFGVVFNFKEVK